MTHRVVHAEIRSTDPDATRAFFSGLFGWTYSDGAYPGYTFVDTGVAGALPTAISPLQGDSDAVLFFIGVDDVEATLAQAEALGGRTIQPAQQVPGVTFGVLADPQEAPRRCRSDDIDTGAKGRGQRSRHCSTPVARSRRGRSTRRSVQRRAHGASRACSSSSACNYAAR